MSMDKYEIRPDTLAAIRDCQGDSQRCLVPGHCIKSTALFWNLLDQPRRGRKAKGDSSAGVWVYAALFVVFLKTLRWMVACSYEMCVSLIHVGLYTHTAISAWLVCALLKPGGSSRSFTNSDAHCSGSSSITRNTLERLSGTPDTEPPLCSAGHSMRYSDGLPSLFLEKVSLIWPIQIPWFIHYTALLPLWYTCKLVIKW